jgi:DnaA: chromosomal replication initiator protein DnaA
VKSTLILQSRCCATSSPRTRRRWSRRNLSSTPLQITSILRRPTLSAASGAAKSYSRARSQCICAAKCSMPRWPESEKWWATAIIPLSCTALRRSKRKWVLKTVSATR